VNEPLALAFAIKTHERFKLSRVQGQSMRQWRVVECCSTKRLAGAVAKYCNDLKRRYSSTEKTRIKLKINLSKRKYLLIYHCNTILMS